MTPLHICTSGDLTKSFSTFVYSHMQKTAGESPDSTSAPSSQHLSEGGAYMEQAHHIIIDAHIRTNASSGSLGLFLFQSVPSEALGSQIQLPLGRYLIVVFLRYLYSSTCTSVINMSTCCSARCSRCSPSVFRHEVHPEFVL